MAPYGTFPKRAVLSVAGYRREGIHPLAHGSMRTRSKQQIARQKLTGACGRFSLMIAIEGLLATSTPLPLRSVAIGHARGWARIRARGSLIGGRCCRSESVTRECRPPPGRQSWGPEGRSRATSIAAPFSFHFGAQSGKDHISCLREVDHAHIETHNCQRRDASFWCPLSDSELGSTSSFGVHRPGVMCWLDVVGNRGSPTTDLWLIRGGSAGSNYRDIHCRQRLSTRLDQRTPRGLSFSD
ncbi:hypothetical protein VTI28DRAFT_8181 [Corynascus sepedonium]